MLAGHVVLWTALLWVPSAYAYLDPGAGYLAVQWVVAAVAGCVAWFSMGREWLWHQWQRLRGKSLETGAGYSGEPSDDAGGTTARTGS